MRKRLLAMLMAICMLTGILPVSAFATGCEHHPSHTTECGYVEAVAGAPCTHECGADCYTTVDNCTHGDNHDADCGWAAATEESEEVPCGHVCDTACETQVLNCGHEHDESCGYVEAVEGVACSFVCNTCSGINPVDEGDPTATDVPVAAIAGQEYTSLKEALEAAITMSDDVTVTLLADVDLSSWATLNTGAKTYNSLTIDGNNKTIKNLAQPLFAQSFGTVVVKNLNFTDVNVSEVTGAGGASAAVISASVRSGDDLTIDNVFINGGTVTSATSYASGLVAYFTGGHVTVNNCSVKGVTIIGANSSGGLFGHVDGGAVVKVTNTTVGGNTVKVNVTSQGNTVKTGALVGTVNTANTKIYVDVTESAPSEGYYNLNSTGDTYQGAAGDPLKLVGRLYTGVTYTGGSYCTDPRLSYYTKNDSGSVKTDSVKQAEGKYSVYPAAQIGNEKYATLYDALTVAKEMTGDVVVKILNDLDLSGWESFDLKNAKYTSLTIDGQRNTIEKLAQAFITNARGTITVKNIDFDNVQVTGSIDDTLVYYACAGVITPAIQSCVLTIDNVHVTGGTITSLGYSGGLIGYVNTGTKLTINGCSVTGVTITGGVHDGWLGDAVGGLLGFAGTTGYESDKYNLIIANSTVGNNNVRINYSPESPEMVGSVIGTFASTTVAWIDVTETAPSTGWYKLTTETDEQWHRITATTSGDGIDTIDTYGSDALRVNGRTTNTPRVQYRGGAYYTAPNLPACAWGADLSVVIKAPYIIDETGKYVIATAYNQDTGAVYKTLADAVNNASEGDTVVLWQNVTEDIVISKNITLLFDETRLSGKISIPNNNPVSFTLQSKSGELSANNITLVTPEKDHHIFDGWFTTATFDEGTAVAGGNITTVSDTGTTYYVKFTKSTYTEIQESDRTFDFGTVAYGYTQAPASQSLTFTYNGDGGEIIAIETSDYFTTSFDGLCATIVPKTELAVGVYDCTILVTMHDHSQHAIIVKFEVTKADSTVTPGIQPEDDETVPGSYTYGDTITFTAEVKKADTAVMTALLDEPETDMVSFYCGDKLIETVEVIYDKNASLQTGTATLVYDTTKKAIPVGESKITAVYGGSVNLNGSESSEITVTLAPKTVTVDGLKAVNREYDGKTAVTIDVSGATLNGTNGETVSIGNITASMENANVGNGKTVTVTKIELTGEDSGWYTVNCPISLTVDITAKIIAAGVAETVNGVTVTGPATMDENGIYVAETGKVNVGSEEFTVTSGTVTVKSDGAVDVSDSTKITNDDGAVISGPAAIGSDGTVSVGNGGSIKDGDTTIEVITGPVAMKDDGTVEVPDESVVQLGDQTLTGPAAVNENGKVTVQTGGKIEIGDKEYTATTGPVTVEGDKITVPNGSAVNDGKNTIAGPTTVDPDDTTQELPSGSSTTVGDTTINVTDGKVTENEDGTLDINSDTTVEIGDSSITGPATVDPDGEVSVDKNGTVTNGDTTIGVDDGSVTVDKDGNVTVPVDTTVSVGDTSIIGPATVDPDGEVSVDKNGTVTNGETKVEVDNGSVTVDKDGNVTVPVDTTVSVGDTSITGPATVDPDGDITVNKNGTVTNGETKVEVDNGSVTVDKDGNVTVSVDTTVSVGDTSITGPATVDPDGDITVDEGGSVTNGDTTVEVDDGSVTVDKDGNVTVPEDTAVSVGDITITGPATVDSDGDIAVDEGGSVTNGDTTVEVDDGSVTVDKDGNVTVPEDTAVSVGDITITGPVTVDPDGEVTVDKGGSVTVGDTTATVTDGSVTVDDNGTVTIPTGSTVSVNGETIDGPAVIDKDGIEVFYKITAGASLTVTKGNSVTFTSNAPFGKFVGVLVDGKTVAASNYTAVSGSTKVTLKATYINTLAPGEYTLTIVSTDGYASTTFTVKSATADIPATGDSEMLSLWIALFTVSAFGLIATLMPKRRKVKYQ